MSSESVTPAIIVTGASRGIGQAIVQELIRRGARVLGVARNLDTSSAPSEEANCSYVQADVTVEADRAKIIETAKRLFNRIDGVINKRRTRLSCPGIGDLP